MAGKAYRIWCLPHGGGAATGDAHQTPQKKITEMPKQSGLAGIVVAQRIWRNLSISVQRPVNRELSTDQGELAVGLSYNGQTIERRTRLIVHSKLLVRRRLQIIVPIG